MKAGIALALLLALPGSAFAVLPPEAQAVVDFLTAEVDTYTAMLWFLGLAFMSQLIVIGIFLRFMRRL